MNSLKRKLEIKKRTFPIELKDLNIKTLENIIDVDEYYTAPQHGYSSAHEFYEAASCINHVHKITRPTLILNAVDDPMLEHPIDKYFILENNPNIDLYLTQHGGHVGFMLNNFHILYHKLALDFIRK
jgi:predicted alpha/beta-fold hydrolase